MKYTIRFGWIDKKTFGYAEFDTNKITINVDLFLADLAIHELLHLKHQEKWGERRVLKQTKRILSRLKVSQIKALARRVRQKARKR